MKTLHQTTTKQSIFLLLVVSLPLAISLACGLVTDRLIPTNTVTTVPFTTTPPQPLIATSIHRPTAINTIDTSVWTSIGPEGGEILALLIDPLTPTTLYAGLNVRGLFKSTNSGGNWNTINTGLNDGTVSALAHNFLMYCEGSDFDSSNTNRAPIKFS